MRSKAVRAGLRGALAAALLPALLVTACGESASDAGKRSVSGKRTPVESGGATTTTVPGGSSAPDQAVTSPPGDAPVPGGGGPQVVTQQPGQQNVHEVAPESISADVSGRRVVAKPVWWSGVAPCYLLDHTEVTRNSADNTVTVRVYEGGSSDMVCTEIAVQKTTMVDLGELTPGTWTIVAARPDGSAGPAPSTTVDVP